MTNLQVLRLMATDLYPRYCRVQLWVYRYVHHRSLTVDVQVRDHPLLSAVSAVTAPQQRPAAARFSKGS